MESKRPEETWRRCEITVYFAHVRRHLFAWLGSYASVPKITESYAVCRSVPGCIPVTKIQETIDEIPYS